MSLYINAKKVTAVLLADGWHDVIPGTFDIDAYYHDGDDDFMLLRGGQAEGVTATGFGFREDVGNSRIYGPLTSVLAVIETR